MDNHKKVPETVKAYIAGFVDGEGCISIRESNGRNKTLHIKVVVGNTNPIVLKLMQTLYGGSLNLVHTANKNHKDVWVWSISFNKATPILKDIRPYLMIKRVHAEAAIQFQSLATYSRYPTKDERLVQERFVDIFRMLNMRGVRNE